MRILVADDHAVLRKGLIRVLAEDFPEVQFGEAGTTDETLELENARGSDLGRDRGLIQACAEGARTSGARRKCNMTPT